jgi:hypothetical protein
MKQCNQCNIGFEVTDADRQFYKRMDVPEPTLCPTCRMQRKLAWRNERGLQWLFCGLTGEKILSMYSSGSVNKIYGEKAWWGDGWDPMEYGRDYDFNRPFFDQFMELYRAVPKCNLSNLDNENCDYCNYVYHNKDSYLLFGSWFSEHCFYGHTVLHSNMVFDSINADSCQYSYELVDCNNCYECFFTAFSENCSNSWFLFNCKNCANCIACTNLNNKENYLFNEPVSKECIEEEKRKISAKTLGELGKKFEALKSRAVRKFMMGTNNQNVTGDNIFNSKNVKEGYVVYDVEDVAYVYRTSKGQKDSYDIMGCSGGELFYDSIHNDFSHHCAFVMNGEDCSDSFYTTNSYHVKNCFGCDGLRHKKYCILNKQYTKEEYEALVPKIIEHMKSTPYPSAGSGSSQGSEWGEFFPVSASPFTYNETIAQEHFPVTKEKAVSRGWKWKDKKDEIPQYEKIIPANRIPDDIKDIPDDILNWAIKCEKSGRLFKIIRQELDFYRKFNLPVPHFHPDERHMARLAFRNPMKLYSRNCAKCGASIQTTYSPDRPEIVYCENCYLKNIY